MPTPDCPDCWFAFYFFYFSRLPINIQRELMEEAEMHLRHAAEAEDKGQFDFTPFVHPKIESIVKGD
jgi:hypothetical protein